MEWRRSNPVFPVADVVASVDWYRRVFDFEPEVVNPPGDPIPVYAVLCRDSISIHLFRSDADRYGLGARVQAQFWLDEPVDALFQHVQAMGVRVVEPPTDRPWRHRDFMVADLDRNIVWVTCALP